MEQLEDTRIASEIDEADGQPLPKAQHFRSSPCQRPAHFRASTPQHFRSSGPLHMAPEAVRIVRLSPPPAIPLPPSPGAIANAAFVRRLHAQSPVHVWPDDVSERLTNRSVWPGTLRSMSECNVQDCVYSLLHASPSDDFIYRRRSQMRPRASVEALPYWESRWSTYRQNLAKPLPIGIAAGLSAVLAMSSTASQSAPTQAALASAERSDDASASRGVLRGDWVPTPVVVAAPTTTAAPAPATTVPPTTAAPQPVATTVKKAVVKPPATVPKATSQCSASKAAAHACWDGLIAQYNWNTTTAFNIMWCESRGNPNAKNPRSTATGLFQILNGPYDPAANVKLAYEMYSKRGWQPWVCKG